MRSKTVGIDVRDLRKRDNTNSSAPRMYSRERCLRFEIRHLRQLYAHIPSSFVASVVAGLSGERGDPPMVVVVTALIPPTGTVLDWLLDTSLALHPLVAPAQKAAEVFGRRFLRCEIGACVL